VEELPCLAKEDVAARLLDRIQPLLAARGRLKKR